MDVLPKPEQAIFIGDGNAHRWLRIAQIGQTARPINHESTEQDRQQDAFSSNAGNPGSVSRPK